MLLQRSHFTEAAALLFALQGENPGVAIANAPDEGNGNGSGNGIGNDDGNLHCLHTVVRYSIYVFDITGNQQTNQKWGILFYFKLNI